MPTIQITLLGRFAVTVDGVPVAESNWSASSCGGAREGARHGARPTTSPRADHRSRLARRHDRRGRAEAAQGGALRRGGPSTCRNRWCCAVTTSSSSPTPTRPSTSCSSRISPAAPSSTRTWTRPARRSRCTAASCSRRTATSRGPRSAASNCGSAISTCCASTVSGRRWSSSIRATSWPISRSCVATRRTAIATPRCASSNAWTARCDASWVWSPAAKRSRSVTDCSPSTTSSPRRDEAMVGRDRELAIAERALLDSAAGRSRTLFVGGPAGVGQVDAARRDRGAREGVELPRRPRHVGAGRGGVAVRAGRRGARRCVPPSSDVARRPRRPPPRGDRPGARRGGDLLDRRELAPAAVRRRRRTGPPGVGHAWSPAHRRRRPRRRRRQPAPPALHRPVDARPTRVHRAQPSAGSADRHAGGDASEPDRPARRDRARARTARRRRHRDARPPPRRRTRTRAGRTDRGTRSGHSVRGQRARPSSGQRAAVGAGTRRQHDRRHRARDA